MIFFGKEMVEHLSKEASKKDKASSSYWDKQHENFNFKNGSFSGVGPIGSYRKRNKIFNLIHRIFQNKFLRMGEGFLKFKSIDLLAKEITKKQNKVYDLDVLRQVLSISFIEHHCKSMPHKETRTACVIGDGYAMATSLLLGQNTSKVILVNLTKTLLIDVHFLKLWLGEKEFDRSVALVTNKQGLLHCIGNKENKVIIIEAKNQELIKYCNIDLAINIASMQEMSLQVINQYFKDLKNVKNKGLYFYCCNRNEKILPDGTIVKFSNYPWGETDIVVDELCPWYKDFYNKKPPFFHKYDGDISHRIVKFKGK